MIDPEKIFSLFSRAEEDPSIKEKAEIAEQLMAVKDTPAFKIGLFKKLVFNHINFSRSIIDMLSRASMELDVNDVQNAGEFIIYNRAWDYIKDLDVKDTTTFETLKKGASSELITSFKLAIHYFQEIEEYEKCAHLKKFCDVCEFFCN